MSTPEINLAIQREEHNVRFLVPQDVLGVLEPLPWQHPLDDWDAHGVNFIRVKSGLSRHVVRFVRVANRNIAIKETSLENARREFASYVRLQQLAIPSLMPIGVVAREDGLKLAETYIGWQPEDRQTGFLITELMEKVVPDSFLFRRGFSKQNRKRIWDAVIRLFVHLHSRGVYWGDASLANMLIHFSTEPVPELGKRTRLRAILADAETVESRPHISDTLRLADVEFFIESMHWTEADLRSSGIVRQPIITPEDEVQILETYRERYAIEQEARSFELITHIDVDKLLGNFDAKGYGKLLLNHIHEHKWYVSERAHAGVSLEIAAHDWYSTIFKPVCKIFVDHGLLTYFPDKNASTLYVEVMEHKYFLSERAKSDVGLIRAVEDFVRTRALQNLPRRTLRSVVRALTSLFKGLSPESPNIYLS